MTEESTNGNDITKVILALDIGSSSIRCTPYEHKYSTSRLPTSTSFSPSLGSLGPSSSLPSSSESTVCAITGCSAVRKVSSVRPNSGRIILSHPSSSSSSSSSLFDEIDHCIDESLYSLRSHFNSKSTNSHDDHNNCDRKNEKGSSFQIIGVGISSFVMNLIGINSRGQLITNENDDADSGSATLTYACNSPEVVQECQRLRNEIENGKKGGDGLRDLYQRTGAPLHNAYALPQLRVYYNDNHNHNHVNASLNENQTENKDQNEQSHKHKHQKQEVHKWTTIASYCLLRWTGRICENNNSDNMDNCKNSNAFKEIPISFSEASWTGMFNFRTCTWDKTCMDLLPDQCRRSLPRVADYTSENEMYAIEEYCACNGRTGTGTGTDNGTGIGTTRVRNPYWERWPELRGSYDNGSDDGNANEINHNHNCRLFLGFGDGVCANIGSKCSSLDRIACTIGTSAAARICLPYSIVSTGGNSNGDDGDGDDDDDFVVPFGLFCYRIDKDHVLLGGALTDGGSVVEHLRILLNLNTDGAFLSCLEQAASSYQSESVDEGNSNNNGSSLTSLSNSNNQNNKLSVVPFLSGERSTGYRGGATGCILGLTRDTKSYHLLRSSLEGVILRLNDIIKLIEGACKNKNEVNNQFEGINIIASGNALERNVLWRQMLSDCTGKRVVKDDDAHEGTSRGVAILIRHVIDSNHHLLGKMNREELVVQDEQIPNLCFKSYWSKQKEKQDNAIQYLSPMWK